MNLELLLLEYGKFKQLRKLQLDSSGICTLLINNTLVAFEKSSDGQGFFVYASLGVFPPEQENQANRILLKGNLFGKETEHWICRRNTRNLTIS